MGFTGLLTTSVILVLANKLLRPLLNLLLLPLNLITLGLFRWVTNVLVFYLVTLVSPYLSVTGFTFNHVYLSRFWVLVLASFLISLIHSTVRWLLL